MKEKFKTACKDINFIKLIIYTVICVLLAFIPVFFSYEKYRYLIQATYVLYAVLAILIIKCIVILYLRYFRNKNKESVLLKAGRALLKFFKRAGEGVKKALGIKPKAAIFGGEDESFYEFDDDKTEKKAKAAAGIKWSSLDDNKARIRFLYAERVKGALAAGCDIKASDTARTVEKKITPKESDKKLFSLYETVRYTDKEPDIDDDDIAYISSGKRK